MSKESPVSLSFSEAPPRVSELRRFTRVFFGRKLVLFGLIIILITVIAAVFAPLLAPYDPYKPDLDNTLLSPNWHHLLGTDAIGRDTLSRLIFGARTSMLVGISAICIGAAVGLTLGLVAGYFGGITNLIIMRFIDALMSFPMILFALAIASLLGEGLKNIIIALGVGLVPMYARLMCGQVLSVKENDYIMAGRSMGAGNGRMIWHHILPNCLPPLIVMVTLMLGSTILAEAGLSFLGVGIRPPGAAWGSMINDGYQRIRTYPILSFAPGVAIMLVVFSLNMVGDGLRDALDPRLRGTI
ncbi:MAG: ABC transporter permease [Dehalococcoidales bacterium]|jgi:ABC-type dipeptide/oligopeptide/nickel transport system permease subunit